MEMRYYRTDAGRSQPEEFLASLEPKYRQSIIADLFLMSKHGDKAPISKRPVVGYSPIWELRTGGYRTMFVRVVDVYWVLHACKKQDEKRGYELSWKRYQALKR
jgi:phage-related protein